LAKDLKLNIKNAQIAQALKKFNKKPTSIPKKAKPKQKAKEEKPAIKEEKREFSLLKK